MRETSRTLRMAQLAVLVAVSLVVGAGAQDARIDPVTVDTSAFPQMRATFRVFLPNGERATSLVGATTRVIEDSMESSGQLRATAPGDGIAWLFAADQSGSMSTVLPAVAHALDTFMSLVGPADRAALIGFDAEPTVLHAFSSDRVRLRQSAARLSASGTTTQLYLSLVDALPQFGSPGLPTERVVVVLSDGRDEGMTYTLDDVVERMRKANVSVAALGVGTGDRTGLLNMRRLAERTGGMYLEVGSEQDVATQVDLIRRQMSALQEVAWTSTLPPDGTARRVRIEIRHNTAVMAATLDVTAPLVSIPLWRQRTVQLASAAVLMLAVVSAVVIMRRRHARRSASALASEWMAVPASRDVAGETPLLTSRPYSADLQTIGVPANKRKTQFMPGVAGPSAGFQRATLVATDGPVTGRSVYLPPGRSTLGRDRANQIVVDDDRASASHAAVTFVGGRVTIEDLGSTNGTYVNLQRIDAPLALASGDVIRCGTRSFRLETEP
jgi:Mg-chelatase subunit ChlD